MQILALVVNMKVQQVYKFQLLNLLKLSNTTLKNFQIFGIFFIFIIDKIVRKIKNNGPIAKIVLYVNLDIRPNKPWLVGLAELSFSKPKLF